MIKSSDVNLDVPPLTRTSHSHPWSESVAWIRRGLYQRRSYDVNAPHLYLRYAHHLFYRLQTNININYICLHNDLHIVQSDDLHDDLQGIHDQLGCRSHCNSLWPMWRSVFIQ